MKIKSNKNIFINTDNYDNEIQKNTDYPTIGDILNGDDIDWENIPVMEEDKNDISEDLKKIGIDINNVNSAIYNQQGYLCIDYKNNTTEIYAKQRIDDENRLILLKKIKPTSNGYETEFYFDGQYINKRHIVDNKNNLFSVIKYYSPENDDTDTVQFIYKGTSEIKQNDKDESLDRIEKIIINEKVLGEQLNTTYKVNRDLQSEITSIDKEEKNQEGACKYSLYRGNRAKDLMYRILDEGNSKGLANEEIIYDNNGNVKSKIVREFNTNGELSAISEYDGDGNLLEKSDDFQFGDFIGTAYQVGTGDCYLLATLNSLSRSSKGQKILRNNISLNKDENGETVYNVKLPGAKISAESLKTYLGEEQVLIQDSYNVTQEDIDNANSNISAFSNGDKNVLIYEIAFAKYRKDVNKTVKLNNLPENLYNCAGLEGYNSFSQIKYTIDGGQGSEAQFILTGIKPEKWNNTDNNLPKKTVNIDLENHKANVITEENEHAPSYKMSSLLKYKKTADIYDEEIEKERLINVIINDFKDGVIDNHAVTAGINVSYSGGTSGLHEISITGMNENEVQFVDSNDYRLGKNRIYKLPLEDFKQCIISLDIIKF